MPPPGEPTCQKPISTRPPGPAAKAVLLAAALSALAAPAFAQDACPSRGDLDVMYCDANQDLVADAPTDAKKWRNPNTPGLRLHPG